MLFERIPALTPRFAFAASVLAFALSLTSPSAAQTVSPQVAELADAATIVLTGRVTDVSVREDAGAIYTYARIVVSEVLKGELDETSVVVKQLGGTLPTLGLYIADQASFTLNEDVLLFLAARPRDGTLYTVGLSRGKLPMQPDLASGVSAVTRSGDRVAVDSALRSAVRDSAAHTASIVAVPPELSLDTPSYTFIPGGEGGPARWHEADESRRIPVDYQDAANVGTLNAAISSWNGVGTRLQLERAATGPAVCPARNFTGNGRIALYWNDPCGEVSDSDSATFGVGGGFFTPGFQKTINGVTFNAFVQGLAILNNAGPHLATGACLQDAVTHVLGHAIGFGHSSSSSAVMYPTLRPGCSSGSSGLGNDDIDGLRFIYPATASGGTPPQTPTSLAAAVALDTVTLSWTPATSGGAAQSYRIEAAYAPGGAAIATLDTPNATPQLVVGGVAPGAYAVRIQARNVLGSSAFSGWVPVTVGPCTAPTAPTNFRYTTADNLVSLTWTPPATGVTQGYILYAGTAPGVTDVLATALGPAPGFSAPAVFGTYFVRLAARNSCAVGPVTTPDLQVVIAPCTTAPVAPTGLTFTRSGNIVTLNWTAPTTGNLPSRYVILAGSAPGVTDLAALATTNNLTSFQTSAPRGRYYVRVLSRNNCGDSVASNEVIIDVP